MLREFQYWLKLWVSFEKMHEIPAGNKAGISLAYAKSWVTSSDDYLLQIWHHLVLVLIILTTYSSTQSMHIGK